MCLLFFVYPMADNVCCCLSGYQQRILGLYVLIDVFWEIKGVTFPEDMVVILVMLVTVMPRVRMVASWPLGPDITLTLSGSLVNESGHQDDSDEKKRKYPHGCCCCCCCCCC